MLVLTRRFSEAVCIGERRVVVLWVDSDTACLQEEVRGVPIHRKVMRISESLDCSNEGSIELLDIQRDKVRLGFHFSDGVRVLREELVKRRKKRRKRY